MANSVLTLWHSRDIVLHEIITFNKEQIFASWVKPAGLLREFMKISSFGLWAMLTCQVMLRLLVKCYLMNALCPTTAGSCISEKTHLVTIKGNYCTYNMKGLKHGGVRGQCFVLSASAVTNFAFRVGVKFKTSTVALPNTAEHFVYWPPPCYSKMGVLWKSKNPSESGFPGGLAWAADDGKATASCLAQSSISVVKSFCNCLHFSFDCKWFLVSTFDFISV